MTTIDSDSPRRVTFGGDDIRMITVGGDVVWRKYTTIDMFEDTDFSEYTLTNLSSGPVQNTSDYTQGSASLELGTTTTPSDYIYGGYAVSTSGLPKYPSAGEITHVDWKTLNDPSGMSFFFGVQSTNTGFAGYQLVQGGEVFPNASTSYGTVLYRLEGDGTRTILDEASFRKAPGNWETEAFLDWSSSGISIRRPNGDIFVSSNDTTYQSGGVGFGVLSGDGTEKLVRFDDVKTEPYQNR